MKSLRQFLALTAAERRLLVSAFLLVAVARLSLLVVPFGRFCRGWTGLVVRLARNSQRPGLTPRRIVWLVSVASRLVPGAHCLARSFAAHLLLARHGHQARLQIGVRKDGGSLDAHAWVELGAEPLFEDEAHVGQFSRLTSIDPWTGSRGARR